jgi:hypothetical protein
VHTTYNFFAMIRYERGLVLSVFSGCDWVGQFQSFSFFSLHLYILVPFFLSILWCWHLLERRVAVFLSWSFRFLASAFSCFSTVVITVLVVWREGVLFSLLAFMPDTQERVRVDVSCMGRALSAYLFFFGFRRRGTGQMSLFLGWKTWRVAGESLGRAPVKIERLEKHLNKYISARIYAPVICDLEK